MASVTVTLPQATTPFTQVRWLPHRPYLLAPRYQPMVMSYIWSFSYYSVHKADIRYSWNYRHTPPGPLY